MRTRTANASEPPISYRNGHRCDRNRATYGSVLLSLIVHPYGSVVAEAAVNSMQHGNKGRPDGRVIIRMNLKDDTIYITVTDDGEGIKNFYPDPNIDRIINKLDPPIGFGMFLIKQLVDDVDFNVRTEKGNGLRMAIKKSKSDYGRV